jgi:ABC-type bacteriocin/lantibiotic exporter with double-glycine peptidase domain
MKTPYYKQETRYTCGATCFRMVLAGIGIKKSEKQIAKLLRTNKVIGTWHRYLPRIAEKFKFDYIVRRKAKISELKTFSKNGWKAIVCFHHQLEGPHYAVVKKINWHSIYLLDPYFGPKERYFLFQFKQMWHDREEDQWFIAIKSSKKASINKK